MANLDPWSTLAHGATPQTRVASSVELSVPFALPLHSGGSMIQYSYNSFALQHCLQYGDEYLSACPIC